ncbi:hypothetical protein HY634_00745 [Candidatus Uhrbacteria bacterium]|nr:hypothetical protein [Candidatus Uhrbacteria bacterium]
MGAQFLQWLRRHALRLVGLLLLLSSPIASWYLYLGFSWIGDTLEWGFLARTFLGAMGIVLGGVIATSGISLLVGRRNLIADDRSHQCTCTQETAS